MGAIVLVQDVTAELEAELRARRCSAAGRDDQPRVPYAARRPARPRRADPRPPGPSRRPRPGAGQLAGRDRAGRLAAARPRRRGHRAGQPRRARAARRPPAAPDPAADLRPSRRRLVSASRCAHSAGRGTERTLRLSVGIRATSAPSTGQHGHRRRSAEQREQRAAEHRRQRHRRPAEELARRLHPADQLGRRDRHLVGADAGVAGRVEEDADRQGEHHHRRVVPEDQRHQQRHEAPGHDDGEPAGRNRSMIRGAASAPSRPQTPAAVSTRPIDHGAKPAWISRSVAAMNSALITRLEHIPQTIRVRKNGRAQENRSPSATSARAAALRPVAGRGGEVGADPAEQHPRDREGHRVEEEGHPAGDGVQRAAERPADQARRRAGGPAAG